MTLSLKARKRWSLLVLLIGLPAYIIVALNVVIWLDPQSGWVEFLVYVVLGVIWILPLKRVFLGVGQPDPDDRQE
ncbi:MAG: DUF2842 domain-containing protein [Roseovarius sp.]